MRNLLLVICSILFLSTTTAQAAIQWIPPARYDHRFNGLIYIYHHSVWWLALRGAQAYTYIPNPGEKKCEMHMPHKATVGEAYYAKLFRHERGHCNGWGSNHPA